MADQVIVTPGNTGGDSGSNNNWAGMILGFAVLAVFVWLFVVYGAPLMRGGISAANKPSIQIPEKIDVKINTN